MNLLLDTNIVLDVLLNRIPWVTDSQAIWDACDKGQATGFVTATTLTNIFYIARRQLSEEVAATARATGEAMTLGEAVTYALAEVNAA